jgi:hypothetical protein
VTWRAVTRIVTEVGDLVQRTGDVAQVEYSVAGRGLHRARGDEERRFLG